MRKKKEKILVGSLAAKAADCKSATKKQREFESHPANLVYFLGRKERGYVFEEHTLEVSRKWLYRITGYSAALSRLRFRVQAPVGSLDR